LFYKFDGIYPHFEKQGGSWRVLFTDPELGRETELVPDLIVVDEEIQSPIYHGVLPPLVSGSLQGGGGLQPESVRFLGVSLPREAVFAMEWAKGPALTSKAHDDVDTVIREALKLRDRASLTPVVSAEVDQDKCAICLTCVRQCPHSAIGFSRTAQVDRIACQACGICVSACPMAAISFKYRESPHPERGLDNFREEGDLSGKIAAFICKNSAARAMEAAAGGICKDLYPVVIPCAGALDQSHILEAFGKGCEGVLVMGCHSGNCASVYGSDIARSRIESARHMLSKAGIEPGRLSFTTLASNSAPEFAEAVISISKISGLKSQENADII
jgi:coenzyme F420-reducing hydrogenase delta subunit/Pyruvate/2-oxoacid:ferredoxin oxidoreductase delta subunit